MIRYRSFRLVFTCTLFAIALFGMTAAADAQCYRNQFGQIICAQRQRASPPMGSTWNPNLPSAYYRQQNVYAGQAASQAYNYYKTNPYAQAGRIAWNGTQCIGGALVAVGTDGAGALVLAKTGRSCVQAGIAARQFGQSIGQCLNGYCR